MLTTPYSATFNVGDGETKQFPYLFDEVSENFISVMVYNTSTGITTTPTYIIDTDQKQIIFGDDTPAPTADEVVCIYRNTPEVQDVSFRTLQGYDAKSLENILSKIVAMIQELKSNYFSTQVLQGDPWQLDLLSSADDGATVNIDFTAKKLIKGLYFKITDGNLQVSADDSNYITMPKSSDIAEFRQISITLEDLSVIKNLQYRVGDTWFDAGSSTGGSNWGGIGGNITDQTDLMNKFTEYVRTDGSSIMTNPLMMRATEDFKCAIAPYWDGVGFFKLNDNNSVTLMASIEYNSGFEPATTNTYNIGASARKWKNLYLSGKAYMSVINNGYDIAVPVTNSADTFALKSQVDDAANSGEQLYTTGVWYAKMHSATVVPTGAEYDGRKYADFSQVDNDNNPIIVIYEGQSGSWVEIARITPPANHVGYITVTSKIWDIAEQTDQQGGEVLWSYNQKTFTPYPKIVSLLNQANTDMDNLTSTGQNIGNWSSNVSNCITEIPQDIQLELNNGTLTLKAGSKVYVPNGFDNDNNPVFDEVSIDTDKQLTTTFTNSTLLVCYAPSMSGIYVRLVENCKSGPSATTTDGYAYDTTTNIISYHVNNGSVLISGCSLPIAIVSADSGGFASIDQVFNGFGYIGSTVFALPGVKGLIPDGRNADGTLKNIAFTINTILTTTLDNNYLDYNTTYYSISGGNPHLILDTELPYYIQANKVGRSGNAAIIGNFIYDKSTLKITSFTSKTVFHAVDYNEADFVVDFQRPTAENNYTWYRKYKSGWVEMGGHITPQDNNAISITYPVSLTTAKIPTVNTSSTYTGDIFIYVQQVITMSTTGFTCRGKAVGTNGISAWENNLFDWNVEGMASS